MEGFTPALVLSLVACLTVGVAALVLFLVAGGRFFSGRPALKPFATAILCALSSAGFMGMAEASEGRHWSLNHLLATCLILAGIGQFITVRWNPGRYATSLVCAIGASALALGPLTSCYLHTWLRVILVVAVCLPLTAASLVLWLLPEGGRRRPFLSLVLANLVLADLALMVFMTDNYHLQMEPDGGMSALSLLRDLIDNTHWRWVLGAIAVSIFASAALVRYQLGVTLRNVGIALVVLALFAAGADLAW